LSITTRDLDSQALSYNIMTFSYNIIKQSRHLGYLLNFGARLKTGIKRLING